MYVFACAHICEQVKHLKQIATRQDSYSDEIILKNTLATKN